MNLIFLDFDGVLNSKAFLLTLPEEKLNGIVGLDPEAVKRLERIMVETHASVVISSTWRILHQLPELRRILVGAGLGQEYANRVIDKTPRLISGVRGDEIADWLARSEGIKSYVILDDNSDMGPLLPRLVQTSFETGLLDEHVELVIEMLAKASPR